MDYIMEKHLREKIVRVMARLYTEMRMDGDEMRDNAQALQAVVDGLIDYEEKENECN